MTPFFYICRFVQKRPISNVMGCSQQFKSKGWSWIRSPTVFRWRESSSPVQNLVVERNIRTRLVWLIINEELMVRRSWNVNTWTVLPRFLQHLPFESTCGWSTESASRPKGGKWIQSPFVSRWREWSSPVLNLVVERNIKTRLVWLIINEELMVQRSWNVKTRTVLPRFLVPMPFASTCGWSMESAEVLNVMNVERGNPK